MVSKKDLGGPVYVQSDNSNGTVTSQALGHIVAINNDDPNHQILYYMPINKVLTTVANTKLLTHTFEEKKLNELEAGYVERNDSIGNIDSIIYTDVYAGTKIGIRDPDFKCISSFAVKQEGFIYNSYGILTAGHCFRGDTGVRVFLKDNDIGYSNIVK
jgi:hypothetical protein